MGHISNGLFCLTFSIAPLEDQWTEWAVRAG